MLRACPVLVRKQLHSCGISSMFLLSRNGSTCEIHRDRNVTLGSDSARRPRPRHSDRARAPVALTRTVATRTLPTPSACLPPTGRLRTPVRFRRRLTFTIDEFHTPICARRKQHEASEPLTDALGGIALIVRRQKNIFHVSTQGLPRVRPGSGSRPGPVPNARSTIS